MRDVLLTVRDWRVLQVPLGAIPSHVVPKCSPQSVYFRHTDKSRESRSPAPDIAVPRQALCYLYRGQIAVLKIATAKLPVLWYQDGRALSMSLTYTCLITYVRDVLFVVRDWRVL